MTTDIDARTTTLAVRAGRSGSMGAWTRHSAWLMMRHPAFLLGTVALLTVWAVTAAGDDAYPSLTQMSWAVQLPLLILVGATYFSALLTALAPTASQPATGSGLTRCRIGGSSWASSSQCWLRPGSCAPWPSSGSL